MLTKEQIRDAELKAWWSAQSKRGDPSRNAHLVTDAFNAGFSTGLTAAQKGETASSLGTPSEAAAPSPRTNAESWAHPTDGTEVVDAKFARILERDNAKLVAALRACASLMEALPTLDGMYGLSVLVNAREVLTDLAANDITTS